MRLGSSVIAAVLAAGVLLVAREAAAYCRTTTCNATSHTCVFDDNGCPRTGAPLTWKSLPLTFRFHAAPTEKIDNDRAREAVRRAFESWSNVSCNGKRTSLRFEEGADITGRMPKGRAPGRENFGIYFREDSWPFDDTDESLALTNQTFGQVTGNIDYSDIDVNLTTREFALSDEERGIDLQAVLTHEVGHYIGLAHSRVRDSIMIARYCENDDRCGGSIDAARALGADDIAAVCALYPPNGSVTVLYDDPPSASCATTPRRATSPLALGSVALIASMLVLARRRRSSRS